jgi:ribosomal protein S2
LSLERYLFSLGAHIGHLRADSYSGLSYFLLGTRSFFTVFDLQKTVPLIKNALMFLEQLVGAFGHALFCYSGVAILNSHIKYFLINIVQDKNQSFSYWRWAPGCITNYRIVFLRLIKFFFRNSMSK